MRKRDARWSLEVPQRGDKYHMVQLAMKNAELSYPKRAGYADAEMQRALEESAKEIAFAPELPEAY